VLFINFTFFTLCANNPFFAHFDFWWKLKRH